jgi:hypothetical protein
MAARKPTTRKSKPPADTESNGIGRIVRENVGLWARSSEVALQAYVEFVKALADPEIAQASARLVEQVAEGWKTALIDSARLLRNAYSSLDAQIKQRQ